MPYFVSISGTAELAELHQFVQSNHGIVVSPGGFLMPWDGPPDVLTQCVRLRAPANARVVVALVREYWSLQ